MTNKKLQGGAFIGGDTKAWDLPLKCLRAGNDGSAFIGRIKVKDGKVRVYHFVNNNICCSRF